MKRTDMQVSNGRGTGATSVTVKVDVPTTDADWLKRYGITPAERDAKALRQVRVDIQNGGARDALVSGIKLNLKGAELQAHVQKFVDGWRNGTRTTKVPVQDYRELPDIFTAEQLQAMKAEAEKQGFHVLLNSKQEEAIAALEA